MTIIKDQRQGTGNEITPMGHGGGNQRDENLPSLGYPALPCFAWASDQVPSLKFVRGSFLADDQLREGEVR